MGDIIRFKENPWPEGHRIIEFVWSGRLDPESGIWFDFHLETEDYYAGDEDDDYVVDEEEEEAEETDWKWIDWQSKITWGNYHSCILSSTYWEEGEKGFLVGTKEEKLDFSRLEGKDIIVDPLKSYDLMSLHFIFIFWDMIRLPTIGFTFIDKFPVMSSPYCGREKLR